MRKVLANAACGCPVRCASREASVQTQWGSHGGYLGVGCWRIDWHVLLYWFLGGRLSHEADVILAGVLLEPRRDRSVAA